MAPTGTFKELSGALTTYLADPVLPFPDDLSAIIDAFYVKHNSYEEHDAERVQDTIQTIWEKSVVGHPCKYPAFLVAFTRLVRVLHTPGRIFHWWDLVLKHMGPEIIKSEELQRESYHATLSLLVSEAEAQDLAEADSVVDSKSTPFVDRLMTTWLAEHSSRVEDPYQQMEKQERSVLISFGKRKPKNFMRCVDKYFVKAEYRTKCLSLLIDLVQAQPLHLHTVLQTPLFGNIIKCLEKDTSTTVVNLALTVLIMFMPNIPTSLVSHLPVLFNIYARLLFWNTGRTESSTSVADHDQPVSQISVSGGWEHCLFNAKRDSDDIPQLLNYFTMLYGLYPINFVDYIRKPERYLRHANGPDPSVEVQPTEIRQRSERFRRLHVLHSNFYTLTIESEKTDFSRWMSSEVAELVADCMSLCAPVYNQDEDVAAPGVNISLPADVVEAPRNALLSGSDNGEAEETSQSEEVMDLVEEPVEESVAESVENSSVTTETPTSKDLADESERSSDAATPRTRSGSTVQRPPPAVITSHIREGDSPTTDLEHQVFLLQNEVRFERYLKLQHSAHIGVLRRQLHQQAASEAELQNLLMSNRSFKSRLEEARKAESKSRQDYERGRALSMKRDADMMSKNRTLREDLKTRKAEMERLNRDVEAYKAETDRLTKLMCTLEEKELAHKQAKENAELVDTQIKSLTAEVTRLGHADGVSGGTIGDELDAAKHAQAAAEARQEELEMLLRGCQKDLERQKQSLLADISVLKGRIASQDASRGYIPAAQDSTKIHEALTEALEAARAKHLDLQRQYSILSRKYTALQSSMFDAPLPKPVPMPAGINTMAAGAMGYIRGHGRRATDEESIVGYNNEFVSQGVSRVDSGGELSTPSGVGGRGFFAAGDFSIMDDGKSLGQHVAERDSRESEKEGSVRHYGRGGVQNKHRKSEDKADDKGKSKEKKTSFRGIRFGN